MTPKRKAITPAPWWNEECQAHIELIKSLRGPARKEAQRRTRLVFRQAKRSTYNALCEAATHENIWQMAKWGTGSRSLPIPPLKDGDRIADTAEARADTFHRVFFPPPPVLPPIRDEGDPTDPFDHEPVTLQEVQYVLASTSPSSAPGPTGITWPMVKHILSTEPEGLTSLLDRALQLGYHPTPWRQARVVMLKKPNKKDPTAPRSYRPITLEECLGKVLEKIVAKRLQYFSNTLGLLPDNQFGGRERASVTDAGASLIEDIQAAWAQGKVYSVLACDVQGFFDNVGHQHLKHTLQQLGLPVPLQEWVSSFVAQRSVAISFDGFCGPLALKPDHGVPQGSPVSPILAELFASSALTCLQNSPTRLKAYVDDHLLRRHLFL